MNKDYKTLVVVILYNKMICDSLTIDSINKSRLAYTTLHIINNGPAMLELKDECTSFVSNNTNKVKLYNFLSNRPLSIIYNEALSIKGFERYIFFDDDSSFEPCYFDCDSVNYAGGRDLELPIIVDKVTGETSYPRVLGQGCIQEQDFIFPQECYFYSIGSGLIIYKSLLDKFESNNLSLFDERYALYGVDLSFFRRIEFLKKNKVTINAAVSGVITHLLSSTSEKMTDWRYRERLYDKILSIRYYSKNNFRLLGGLVKAFCLELIKFNFKNIYEMSRVFIRGKHPRC